MPHDPVRAQDTRAWLTRAYRDLQAAQHDMKATPPLVADAAFLCQQAAEKVLKAFLAWHDVPFRRTHDLTELGETCVKIDGSLQEPARSAGPLTEYA